MYKNLIKVYEILQIHGTMRDTLFASGDRTKG